MIVVSDDTGFLQNWDQIILNATLKMTDYILKVYDGIQQYIVTMPVIHRDYYNRFGYIYHPDFNHMFCDTALTHTADVLKRIIWRNDLVIRHNHYSVTTKFKDEVSIKADSTLQSGCDVYFDLIKKHLLLDSSVNIWDLKLPESRSHRDWLKKKGFPA